MELVNYQNGMKLLTLMLSMSVMICSWKCWIKMLSKATLLAHAQLNYPHCAWIMVLTTGSIYNLKGRNLALSISKEFGLPKESIKIKLQQQWICLELRCLALLLINHLHIMVNLNNCKLNTFNKFLNQILLKPLPLANLDLLLLRQSLLVTLRLLERWILSARLQLENNFLRLKSFKMQVNYQNGMRLLTSMLSMLVMILILKCLMKMLHPIHLLAPASLKSLLFVWMVELMIGLISNSKVKDLDLFILKVCGCLRE